MWINSFLSICVVLRTAQTPMYKHSKMCGRMCVTYMPIVSSISSSSFFSSVEWMNAFSVRAYKGICTKGDTIVFRMQRSKCCTCNVFQYTHIYLLCVVLLFCYAFETHWHVQCVYFPFAQIYSLFQWNSHTFISVHSWLFYAFPLYKPKKCIDSCMMHVEWILGCKNSDLCGDSDMLALIIA